jgi:hypothetical protein
VNGSAEEIRGKIEALVGKLAYDALTNGMEVVDIRRAVKTLLDLEKAEAMASVRGRWDYTPEQVKEAFRTMLGKEYVE